MPWITVDCQLPEHAKMAELPSDSARWGWIVVLVRAKLQRNPGRFASERHFKEVLGRHSRHLASFKGAGLIDVDGDALVVHDWDRHQWKVAKERQREDNGETNEGPKEDSHAGNAVSVPVEDSLVGELGSGEEGDALVVYHSLTGRFPTGNVKLWLEQLIGDFGDDDVGKALAAELVADKAVQTLLSRTENRLRLDSHSAGKKAAAARVKAEEEERQKIQTMPPEQRAANLSRLKDEMKKAGLLATK